MSAPKTLQQALDNILTKLGNTSIRVGVEGERAKVAMYMEYGTQHVPARPFLAPSQVAHAADYTKAFSKLTRQAVRGEDITSELKVLADTAAQYTKSYVTEGTPIPPPLAPGTVKAKGHDRPLVETGELVASIVGEVVPNAI